MAAVLGRAVVPADILAIAVSGGPDSMALLALADAAWPGQVIAATVDHGLRAAAAGEAAMVAGWCASPALSFTHRHHPQPSVPRAPSLSHREREKTPKAAKGEGDPAGFDAMKHIPHTVLYPANPLGPANLQAAARNARYALLADWAIAGGATMLATAHHADDQAETFLMRAARGSGLAGLSGIRPTRDIATLPLIRPLLGWRCRELRDIVMAEAIPFVDDPSNTDAHYDRTRFRRLLTENDWLDPQRFAHSAAFAREGHEALEAMVDWLWRKRQAIPPAAEDRENQTWLDFAGLPREIKRRLSREAISLTRDVNGITRPAFSPATNIEPLLDTVERGTSVTQAGILVSRAGDIWHFRAAPPRRDTAFSQS